MKKFIVAILATLYMSASIGATVNMHYCMGKLIGTDVFHFGKNDKCGTCGMVKGKSKKGCCNDEHKQFKLNTDQKIADNILKLALVSGTAVIPGYITYLETVIPSVTEQYPSANAPPRAQLVPLFILNCVFRI